MPLDRSANWVFFRLEFLQKLASVAELIFRPEAFRKFYFIMKRFFFSEDQNFNPMRRHG